MQAPVKKITFLHAKIKMLFQNTDFRVCDMLLFIVASAVFCCILHKINIQAMG